MSKLSMSKFASQEDYLKARVDVLKELQTATGFDGHMIRLVTEAPNTRRNLMNFGQALEALKSGQKVAREGWNGKNMFLLLVPGSTFKVNRAPLLGIYPEGAEINYRPHIDMKTVDGEIVPWVASQSDLLVEDWVIVEA